MVICPMSNDQPAMAPMTNTTHAVMPEAIRRRGSRPKPSALRRDS